MSIEFEDHPSTESVDEAYQEPRRLGGTDVLRGAMVVGTAVLVGAVLLISGIGGGDESALTSATASEGGAEGAASDGGAEGAASDGSAEGAASEGGTEGTDGGGAGSGDSAVDGTPLNDGVLIPDNGSIGDGMLFDPIGDPIPGAGGAGAGSSDGGQAGQPDSFGQPASGADSEIAADDLPSGLTEGSGTTDEVLPSEDASAVVTGAAAASESAARLPEDVKVLVLNGIGTQGIAARGTAAVEAAGYTTGTPKNAEPSPQLSGIYYTDGYRREALDVAQVYSTGLDGLVKPLTADSAPVADTQSANVIVVIGSDQAIPLP